MNRLFKALFFLTLMFLLGCQGSSPFGVESFDDVGGAVFHVELEKNNASEKTKYLEILKKRLDIYTNGNYELTEVGNKIDIKISKSIYSSHFKDLIQKEGKLKFYEAFSRDEFQPIANQIDTELEGIFSNKFYGLVDTMPFRNVGNCIGMVVEKNKSDVSSMLTMAQKKGILPQNINHHFFENKNGLGVNSSQLFFLKNNASNILNVPFSSFNSIELKQSMNTGMKELMFEFDEEVTEKWKNFTTKNLNKIVLVVLDFELLSAPLVNSPITIGRAGLSLDDEKYLEVIAALLQSEPLPYSTFKVDAVDYFLKEGDELKTIKSHSQEMLNYQDVQNTFKRKIFEIENFVKRTPQLKPEIKSALISDIKNIMNLDCYEYVSLHGFSPQQLRDILSNAKKIIQASRSGVVNEDPFLEIEKLLEAAKNAAKN